ncbi:hypothetical protein QJS10_CPA06g01741 [Acorus calamus]|uniref:Lipoxygenase domain-containing protein n=1 Tax=Acorus calamus TaxID=4465 RepID=A0AAV9EL41_ACOCL|nr:hypothetical protein QJS10_CPA06g01741 [Acorus calamus]
MGERKFFERIYDYDVYNDLGGPDECDDMARPVLGGQTHPYPRRCRTGRPRTNKDPRSEKRNKFMYVPRDEGFSEAKELQYCTKSFKCMVQELFPSEHAFPFFDDINSLFHGCAKLPTPHHPEGCFLTTLRGIVNTIVNGRRDLLLFETPAMIERTSRDKFSWLRDEEFSRQTLAGLNPLSIQLVQDQRPREGEPHRRQWHHRVLVLPAKYSMELSSVAYARLWRFDMEALPTDLIRRPTIARANMPTEAGRPAEELERFLAKPERALLECFPSQAQAKQIMAVLGVLSCHSPDEEYIGERLEPAWAEDAVVRKAFMRFNERLMEIERIIDARNADVRLKNRTGAGVVPYELLKPFSKPGVTGMGVPASISI